MAVKMGGSKSGLPDRFSASQKGQRAGLPAASSQITDNWGAALRVDAVRKLEPSQPTTTEGIAASLPPFDDHVNEIDWNSELRKIEREYDGLPPERTRTQIRLQKLQEITAKQRFEERLALVGIWARLVLVGALALGLFWWPYAHGCGFPLAAFLVSELMVIVGGLSLAVRTWRDQHVWPFIASALFIVIAWTVIALHTLPRLGYSPVPTTSAGWRCRG